MTGNYKLIASLVLCLFAAGTVSAQDMLARQTPTDRMSKAVDTLALQRLIERDTDEDLSVDLYDGWDNVYAHKATELPETYKIDLRGFCMPTQSRAITSNFGYRWKRAHKGLDIKVYVGDTIRAAFDGKVRIVRYEAKGYGKYIVIRHNNGLETIYGHLSKQIVKENQMVKAGDPIGLGGNTGRSTGSHLHFETRLCGVALNPALMFDFRAQDVIGDYYLFNKKTYEKESLQATRLRGMIGNGSYTEEDVHGTSVANAEGGSEQGSNRSNATVKRKTSAQAKYHKVKKGETLSSIAKRQGTTVARLCKLNHLSTKSKIRVGQIIRCS